MVQRIFLRVLVPTFILLLVFISFFKQNNTSSFITATIKNIRTDHQQVLLQPKQVEPSRRLQTNDDTDGPGNVFQSHGQEYEIELESFQLYLEYDDVEPLTSSQEMKIFSATQVFLMYHLNLTFPSTFLRLQLFQFVRDFNPQDEDNNNGGQQNENNYYAKVAVTVRAFFSSRSMDVDQIQEVVYGAFVGENKFNFVKALEEIGLTSIVDVTLMELDGSEMEFSDDKSTINDGDNIGDNDNTTSGTGAGGANNDDATVDREMSDDMRMLTILLSLMIPVAVICLACAVFGYRSIREIKWSRPKTTPDAPIWQSEEHLRVYQASQQLRQQMKEGAEEEHRAGSVDAEEEKVEVEE